MSLRASDVMQRDPRTVAPERSLVDLERDFLSERRSGFPVISPRSGDLVGIVSRSDIVRTLCVEQSRAEQISDYYHDIGHFDGESQESLDVIARRVGQRLEGLRVSDVMSHAVVSVESDTPIEELAKRMLERHVHRLPVTEGGRLVGIVTSLDLVRLFAEGRVSKLD